MPSSRRIMVETSLIRGTFLSRTSSSVSRQAARMGRTAFLEPLIGTRPTNRVPPSIRSWATDPLGYQPARPCLIQGGINGGYIAHLPGALRLRPAAATQFGESQACFRPGQRGRRGRLVGVGQLLLEQALRPAAGFLGAGLVDVLGAFRRIGEDGHLVRTHLQESSADEEEQLLAIVADLHG